MDLNWDLVIFRNSLFLKLNMKLPDKIMFESLHDAAIFVYHCIINNMAKDFHVTRLTSPLLPPNEKRILVEMKK